MPVDWAIEEAARRRAAPSGAQRARADGPHEGHARGHASVPARRSSRSGCGCSTARRSSRRSCGGPTSAVRVHDRYQSFFPPDVTYVADHARARDVARSRSHAARTTGSTTAHDRRAEADLSLVRATSLCRPRTWRWAPSRTSSAATTTRPRRASSTGADHRISPGKKQWTWGNARVRPRVGPQADRRRRALRRADGRRLHRQPARLLVPRAVRDPHLQPVRGTRSGRSDRPTAANREAAVSLRGRRIGSRASGVAVTRGHAAARASASMARPGAPGPPSTLAPDAPS